jgi:hypothetical protein
MHNNRFLLSLFLGTLFLIPVFMTVSYVLAGLVAILAALILLMALIQFLSNYEIRKYRGRKIEFITFFRHNVLRTYLKPKTIWVVFDKMRNKFRPANLREFPVKIGISGLFGSILLYMGYMILRSVPTSMVLVLFRIVTLSALFLFGFYSVFVSLARFMSLFNKKSGKLSKKMNRNRALVNFAIKRENTIEITPNFLITQGFVTSVELLSKKDMNRKKLENFVLNISKEVNRL